MTDSILAPVAALTLPDSAALAGNAERALAFIREFSIASSDDYSLAADELRAIKARANGIEDQRTKITGPINTALKAINSMFKGPGDILSEAEKILKGKMLAWDQEQQRIAAEARRKAEEAAAAERTRLAAEAAERQREADAQADVAAKARAAGDAQAAALATAQAERAKAEAAAAATTAQLVVAAPPAIEPAKVAGISTSKKIDFAVKDLLELVKHIAQHPELIGLVCADEVRLRAYVRGLGAACVLPGVNVFETSTLSARSK